MSFDSSINEFINVFLKDRGLPTNEIESYSLAGDGSRRLFRRLILSNSSPTFIVMENPPNNEYLKKENLAYLMIGKHLFKKGMPIPEIYSFDLENGWFILEDMGDRSLQDEAFHSKNRIVLYKKLSEILFRIQIEGAEGFNTDWCCQTERYDSFVMRRHEADYFRDSFLSNYLGMNREWAELEEPFNHLAAIASMADNHHFLHRDFQSRNVMVSNDKLGILDWQGGRLGPLPYDLASLLIDPYANLSHDEKKQIYQQYLLLLKDHNSEWIEPFEKYFPYLAIQRNLQILGAFSYLTKVQKKAYFETYISPALNSLHLQLDDLADPKLSSLMDLVKSLI